MDYSGLHHFSMIKYGALSIAVWHISILSSRLCSVSSVSPKCVPAVARHLGAISMRKYGKHSKHMERYGKQYGNIMIIWWSFHHEKLAGIFDYVDVQNAQNKPHLLTVTVYAGDRCSRSLESQRATWLLDVAGLFASHYAGKWWNIVGI